MVNLKNKILNKIFKNKGNLAVLGSGILYIVAGFFGESTDVVNSILDNAIIYLLEILFALVVMAIFISPLRASRRKENLSSHITTIKLPNMTYTLELKKEEDYPNTLLLNKLFFWFIISELLFIILLIWIKIDLIYNLVEWLPPFGFGAFIVFATWRIKSGIDNKILLAQFQYSLLLTLYFFPLLLIPADKIKILSSYSDLLNDRAGYYQYISPISNLEATGLSNTWIKVTITLTLILYILVCLFLFFRKKTNKIQPKSKKKEMTKDKWEQEYSLCYWDSTNKSWSKISDSKLPTLADPKNSAVLLIHGFHSDKNTWSNEGPEKGSTSITSKYGSTHNIFALDFSTALLGTLNDKFYLLEERRKLYDNIVLNNYVWELFLSIKYLKEVLKFENIHLIAHSTGGVVVRALFSAIDDSEAMDIGKEINIEYKDNNISTSKLINKITWLATPHCGAMGGSATLLNILDNNSIVESLLKAMDTFKPTGLILDDIGRFVASLGSDAMTPLDLEPGSKFMMSIGDEQVSLFHGITYQNFCGSEDRVVGIGAIIKEVIVNGSPIKGENIKGDCLNKKNYIEDFFQNCEKTINEIFDKAVLNQKLFEVDHTDIFWEQIEQWNERKSILSIHHSPKVLKQVFG